MVIPQGQTSVTFQVQAEGDMLAEPIENFGARLTNPSPGVTVGPASEAIVEIADLNGMHL